MSRRPPTRMPDPTSSPDILPAILVPVLLVIILFMIAKSICCIYYFRRKIRKLKQRANKRASNENHDYTQQQQYNIKNTLTQLKHPENQTDDAGYDVIPDEIVQRDLENGFSAPVTNTTENTFNNQLTQLKSIRDDDSGYERTDDYVHDYDQPFFEPATQEEELICQITELNVPYIKSTSLELQSVLGSGQFGMVYKGVWLHEEDDRQISSEVAVKMMKDEATEEDKVKFLQEAAIMGQFNHPNILRIQGIVTEEGKLRMVIDLMQSGDLRNYLLTLEQNQCYTDLNPSEQKQLLMSYSRQVVYGMGYLAAKKYVHRDLAARNILVSDDGTCKIADFGLSRDLHEESYYKSHGGMIPVKWTAPEAINYRKYSLASDVWSYGCLLYEIWSLGKKPFSHLTNAETIRAVATGYRLPPPPGCPKPIYKFMIDCWHPDPESRPTAPDICTTLQKPDYIFLKWQGNEETIYSEETRTLGAALEHGEGMHLELQKIYKI